MGSSLRQQLCHGTRNGTRYGIPPLSSSLLTCSVWAVARPAEGPLEDTTDAPRMEARVARRDSHKVIICPPGAPHADLWEHAVC